VTVLTAELRAALEKAIVEARDAAEAASRVALDVLGVDNDRTASHLGEEDRALRVSLRAEARQLGGFEHLIEECGYEQWHRMLFARFLAENELLIHPEHGVSVTLEECEEIAESRGGTDRWLVASEFAAAMLPGIFRADDPVLQVALAPEGQQRLEEILAGLPSEVLRSEDGLGWVYQYWQAKKKKEVNASERKIGGADIAPVTQLFTENYMVRFLLENTLGAWWASGSPNSPLLKEWEYLRFDEDGKPAAGSFPGWPETVAEVTVMDPCCGSGHFLVVAFEMLRKMRMEAEGLSAAEAGDAVLRDNLFGLELDPRCTQIAAFALALQAWKTGGYRELPIPNIACSGISAKGRLEDWKKLAREDERLERSLERLHALFSDGGDLGSLIDPLKEVDGDLLAAHFEDVGPVLASALEREQVDDPSAAVFGNAAAGAAHAARLLARRHTLVATNPPFLGRGGQGELLKRFCKRRHGDAAADLATTFLDRCFSQLADAGTVAIVSPQSFLYLTYYKHFRKRILRNRKWNVTARLGAGAFEAISGEVVNVALLVISEPIPEPGSRVAGLDAQDARGAGAKARELVVSPLMIFAQERQLENPGAIVTLAAPQTGISVAEVVTLGKGICTGDKERFVRKFWEGQAIAGGWEPMQTAPVATRYLAGLENVLYWQEGRGVFVEFVRERLGGSTGAWIRGREVWGRRGIAVGRMARLPCASYSGALFDDSMAALVPDDPSDLGRAWNFISSDLFRERLRALNQKLSVDNTYLSAISIDETAWAGEPPDEPLPGALNPTQWVFSGVVTESELPLQVAVSRLSGYRWPRQTGSEFPDCPELGPDGLEPFADEDGIVCLPAIRAERPAAERLRALLAVAFSQEWSPAKEADLLDEADCAGKSLEQWLRDGFFEQHCQLFHQRPLVWQIWDGRKDGFSALLNYHRLDRANLEKLIYTYLGEWIRQQREAAGTGTPGADLRLAAAQELQQKLELILEGEDPYDVFVRWKPLQEQPIGWEPALNDGVRLNIRPFVTAGVLRKNPKIKWGKDRGRDLESAPWYPVFKGDRINDHHLTLAEKRVAREAAERRATVS
jgi:hypothetical protein